MVPTNAFVAFTFCWIVWVIFTSLRRYLMAKSNAAIQEKVFARIDSTEALLALAASDSGRAFLESLTLEKSEPYSPFGRILFGIQAGIVLIFFGLAMLFLHHHTNDDHAGFIVIGTGAVGLGLGFAIASAASVWFSRRLGLLDRDRRG